MVLFNLLTLIPLLAVLNLSELKTVSDNDLKSVEVVESVDDVKIDIDEPILKNSVDFNLSKSVADYENDLYIGWNYFTYSTSTGVSFTVLCNGYNCTSISYSSYDQCFNAYFDTPNKTVTFDVNGSYYQKYNYGSSSVKLNFEPLNFTDRSIIIRLVNSGVVKEVSSGGDSPDTPDSGGDYADILTSIDEKLTYFQELFYYGDNLDSMGDGFKILIILTFLVAINLVIKIINWR